MIRIVLVDDHTVVRDGLKLLFDTSGVLEVVGEASTAEQALNVVAATPCDVVVADLSLPDRDGIWLISVLKERHPQVKVVILSMYIDTHTVVEALRAGAGAYLGKSSSYRELLEAITRVQEHDYHLTGQMAGTVIESLKIGAGASNERLAGLSAREEQVLVQMAAGLSNQDIAEVLKLSPSTVKSHIRTLYRKLEVEDRTQAILRAMRLGLISVRKKDSA